MTTYDAILFEPPAPVARVILRNPDTGMMWSDVPMLIDCGADDLSHPRRAPWREASAARGRHAVSLVSN